MKSELLFHPVYQCDMTERKVLLQKSKKEADVIVGSNALIFLANILIVVMSFAGLVIYAVDYIDTWIKEIATFCVSLPYILLNILIVNQLLKWVIAWSIFNREVGKRNNLYKTTFKIKEQ